MPQVADRGVGAVAVGLVDHEDVADLEDARPWRPGSRRPCPARAARRWCRPGRRPRPRTGRRRRSRPAPRRSRPRRAPAAPAASTTTARRGGRGWPSTGCRRPGRARGPASGPGHRAAPRRRTARTGRRRARPTRWSRAAVGADQRRWSWSTCPRPGAPVRPMTAACPPYGASAAITSRSSGDGVLDQRDQPRDRRGVDPRARRLDELGDVAEPARHGVGSRAGSGRRRARGGSARRPGRRRRRAPPRRRRRRAA